MNRPEYKYLEIVGDKWIVTPPQLKDVTKHIRIIPKSADQTLQIYAIPLEEDTSRMYHRPGQSKQTMYSDEYKKLGNFLGLFGSNWSKLFIEPGQEIDCGKEWKWDVIDYKSLSFQEIDNLMNLDALGKNLYSCYLPTGATEFSFLMCLYNNGYERHFLTRDNEYEYVTIYKG